MSDPLQFSRNHGDSQTTAMKCGRIVLMTDSRLSMKGDRPPRPTPSQRIIRAVAGRSNL